jgi:hypothetical protein
MILHRGDNPPASYSLLREGLRDKGVVRRAHSTDSGFKSKFRERCRVLVVERYKPRAMSTLLAAMALAASAFLDKIPLPANLLKLQRV